MWRVKEKSILTGNEDPIVEDGSAQLKMHCSSDKKTKKDGEEGESGENPSMGRAKVINISSERESSEDKEGVDDVGGGILNLEWEKEIKSGKLAKRNVLQLPQYVVANCFNLGEHLGLVDEDTCEVHNCVLHTAEREYCIEKYIGHGWYGFGVNKNLKRGHTMAFKLCDLPVDQIFAKMLKRY